MKKRKGLYLVVLMMLFTMVFGMSSMAATKVVTLKNNRLTGVSVKDYDDVVYYKLSVNQTGYLAVYGYKQYSYSSAGEKNGLNVQLCNSRKQPLEEEYNTYLYKSNNWKNYYGVKKGVYYLRVKGSYDAKIYLKSTFVAVKEVCGSSKARASLLTRNKTRYGLLIAGENGAKEEWYKVRLPKAQKLKLKLSGKSSGYVAFEIIPASKKVTLFGSYQSCWNNTKLIQTRNNLPAGTYYIKVYRSNGKSSNSGYYSIKWM